MSAKDTYHDQVKNALIKAGWTITHDPYTISVGQTDVYVDLGAEQIIGAEKEAQKIAVEIKSFRSPSSVRDIENAMGQYVFYRSLLKRQDADRKLYLAVPETIYLTTLDEPIARPVLEDEEVALIAFDPHREEIVKWKS